MEKVILVICFTVISNCVYSWQTTDKLNMNFVPVKYWQEDLNGDGNIEAIKLLEDKAPTNYPYQMLCVSRKNEVIFRSEMIQKIFGGMYLIKDLTPRYPGKEIVVINPNPPFMHVTKKRQWLVSYYGYLSKSK